MIMTQVKLSDATLRKAAEKGIDEFVGAFVDAIKAHIGGALTADTMPLLNSEQITLLAWDILHEEVMDGGLIQLIHNGYGPFIYLNPTAKAFRNWGMQDLYRLISKSFKLYKLYHEDIERDMTDEEFMALYEKYPEFDDYDDLFVESEEQWTEMVAQYIDRSLDEGSSDFAVIEESF